MSTPADPKADSRQTLTNTVLVEIIGTLVNDVDIIDILTQLTAHCVELLDAAAAGILVADDDAHLRVIGATTEQVQLLELFQIQHEQGPSLDCYITGQSVAAIDLNMASPWPQFAAHSVAAGYPCVHAIPLRLNNLNLGCLNLFRSHPQPLTTPDAALAQALADLASIAVVQHHASLQTGSVARMRHTMHSRIAIEQAKSMIAEDRAIGMHDAFTQLRTYARQNQLGLSDVANDLLAGRLNAHETSPSGNSSHPGLDPERQALTTRTTLKGTRRVVQLSGELDLGSRHLCLRACLPDNNTNLHIDISAITFMDCAGYGSLIAARLAVEQQGGAVTITNPAGQPARLFVLLAELSTSASPTEEV